MNKKKKTSVTSVAALRKKKLKKNLKKPENVIGKIQQIDWYDHNTHSGGWRDPSTDPSCVCHSAGRVVKEDDKWVTVCTNWNDSDDQIGSVMNIFRPAIIKRVTLRE